MEDEDLVFNNTYLMDLKAGRCEVSNIFETCEDPSNANNGEEGNMKRLSELRWRNSLCPPHLRSSYATEVNLENFRENYVKVHINLHINIYIK